MKLFKTLVYNGKRYEDFLISPTGILKRKSTGRILKWATMSNGRYPSAIVSLGKRGKSLCIKAHKAVAENFIPNPENKPTVNHKDGDTTNYDVNNLEWATAKEQMRHSVDVLGNFVGEKSHTAKRVVGYDKITGEKLYDFISTVDAAKVFCDTPEDKIKVDSIASIIQDVARGGPNGHYSYKGCVWKYE